MNIPLTVSIVAIMFLASGYITDKNNSNSVASAPLYLVGAVLLVASLVIAGVTEFINWMW